jgi:hypothetical protein
MEMWETYKVGEPTDPMKLWREDKSLFWKEMLKRWYDLFCAPFCATSLEDPRFSEVVDKVSEALLPPRKFTEKY